MFNSEWASHGQVSFSATPETTSGVLPGTASVRLNLAGQRTRDPHWLLVEEGFTLAREHEVESLFAIANGYVGNRGSLAEGSPLSAPATFIAGVFEMPQREGAVPGLFVMPDWTGVRAWIGDQPLSMTEGQVLEHRRILDLRRGVLWREWRHRGPDGRVTHITALRLASIADRHLLLQSVFFAPENYSAHLRLECRIALAPEVRAWTPSEEWKTRQAATRPNILPLALHAPGRDVVVAFAASSQLQSASSSPGRREIELDQRSITERFSIELEIGAEYRLDRLVSIYTSRDGGEPVPAAMEHVHRAIPGGIAPALAAHASAWEGRWQQADIIVSGDDDLQRALRFAAYHLISAANPEDERVSIGARALTGESYKGHVFWDTEIYMLPFYIFTHPAPARALLMYRHHTLPAAREKARAFGYRGAMYPWESADTGEEVTPRWVVAPGGEVIEVLNGEMENHITADIAYAVWQYWQATADDDFLLAAGAEILLETARFWASRGTMEADGFYHIRHVIGPDEYHENVDDSAYTNLMAAWNMERGAELAQIIEQRWPQRWRELAASLQLPAD
jgi:kojibiose phosphorylase